MNKRKIYFWIGYIICFVLFFFILRMGFYRFVPDTKWMDILFVILLFIIVSPVSTIISTKMTDLFLGPEE